ncbi:MAG: S-layer homology domain-containing protein [Candidatus Limnocylindria bacterium]
MIRAPRVPRPSRPVLLTILVTALLAFPMGIALASHQFSDVPNSNAFHADIDALVDAGVTAGCGSGKYCPKANVTREQMAAFMNRLGALAPGKTPVVNADEVDGLHATAFHRFNANAPGGSTQYGAWALTATSSEFAGETEVSFPVPFASAPNVQVVQFGASPTAQCAGSAASPSAVSG